MFSKLHCTRLPQILQYPLISFIWILIIVHAICLYIRSWRPNKGFNLEIRIIPASLYSTNGTYSLKSRSDDTTNTFILDQWMARYPKIETSQKRCARWQCQPSYNISSGKWNLQRYRWWDEVHESQKNTLLDPKQNCEYIFIGDSIMFGWKSKRNIFAHNGATISDIGWRLHDDDGFKNMKQCLLNHKSPHKSMILLIGGNDVGYDVPYDVALTDYDVLLNQFAEFLEDINKQQRVMLDVMALFPRGKGQLPCPGRCDHWNGTNTMFYSINFMNEYLKSFIEHQDNDNMRFIDCNRDLLQRVGRVDWKDLKGGSHQFITGYINQTMSRDYVHLTKNAYGIWAQCLKRHLRDS